jgi:hypothetical protein
VTAVEGRAAPAFALLGSGFLMWALVVAISTSL